MGSLFEAAAAGGATPSKRIPLLRTSAPAPSSLHRLTRFLLSDKVGYLHWVFTVAAFLFVVALFQAFLPGSPDEAPDGGTGSSHLGEIGMLDFGDGIRFVPSKLLQRWERERREANWSAIGGFAGRSRRAYGLRKPLLALVDFFTGFLLFNCRVCGSLMGGSFFFFSFSLVSRWFPISFPTPCSCRRSALLSSSKRSGTISRSVWRDIGAFFGRRKIDTCFGGSLLL